ncbi:MAG: hypothetical protein M3384_13315 [Acidobacteriota bacterium]|nr:hypothetical protein [Acidobacteriota bacterium]
MNIPQGKRRRGLAIASLVIGILTIITTVILIATEMITDFGFQVRRFWEEGNNHFAAAITFLVSFLLIVLPIIGLFMGIMALIKVIKNQSLHGGGGKVIAVSGIIANLVSGLTYFVLLALATLRSRSV